MELEYTIRKSHRAKRIILRVNHQGAVEVVVPWFIPKRLGHAFLGRRLDWVARVKKRQRALTGGRSSLPKKILNVVVPEYRSLAQKYFEGEVTRLSAQLGVVMPKIRIRDFKTQWGSCNRNSSTVSFSWRLLLAPENVRAYVAAHEVAHLVQANHSKKFWEVVVGLDSDFPEARKWLKKQGRILRI